MDDPSPGVHRRAEVTGHGALVEKPQRIQDVALARSVGADQ
ncbi:MAG: hypothetical protein OXH70_03835 [Acidobacteria bacterium]|nr:hypothetical protein [Acidobacteriota bacterium]